MDIKVSLYRECHAFLDLRLETLQKTISGIQKALLSETKSSAGDKHETGRAMLQLEREKTGTQLAEVQKEQAVLAKVSLAKSSKVVRLGSVVYSSQANYFIAISAGEINVDETTYYAISPKTPIGQLLISKSVGDVVEFRGSTIRINKIL